MQVGQHFAGVQNGLADVAFLYQHMVEVAVDVADAGAVHRFDIRLGVLKGMHDAHLCAADGLDGAADVVFFVQVRHLAQRLYAAVEFAVVILLRAAHRAGHGQ